MTQLAFDWADTADTAERLDLVDDREQIRAMELITYACRLRIPRTHREFHPAHTFDDAGQTIACPGLVTKLCGLDHLHTHHRWHTADAFYWCSPYDYLNQEG